MRRNLTLDSSVRTHTAQKQRETAKLLFRRSDDEEGKGAELRGPRVHRFRPRPSSPRGSDASPATSAGSSNGSLHFHDGATSDQNSDTLYPQRMLERGG